MFNAAGAIAEDEMVLCCRDNDVPGFLKLAAQIAEYRPFEPALLQGKLHQAADAVDRVHDRFLQPLERRAVVRGVHRQGRLGGAVVGRRVPGRPVPAVSGAAS